MDGNRDVKTTRRPNLAEHAGNARARGADNLARLLRWTFQWGWTTDAVAQQLLGVQRRVAAEYARKGYLLRVEPPMGHKAAYVVAQAHQTHAADLYEEQSGKALPYTYPRTSVPFAALAEHQERAQLVAIDELKAGGTLTVDRELRNGGSAALPDFVIKSGGLMVWHEVELTAKYQERLLFQLEEREQARRRGEFHRLVFHCRSHGIARNLQAELAKPVLPPVVKRADGKIVRLPGEAGWKPDKLRALCEVRGPGGPVMPEEQLSLGDGWEDLAADL